MYLEMEALDLLLGRILVEARILDLCENSLYPHDLVAHIHVDVRLVLTNFLRFLWPFS